MLVCIREEEIQKFKPEEYWSIHGAFTIDKDSFNAELSKIKGKKAKIGDKKKADEILAAIKKESFSILKVTDKKRLKNPVAPFMTSSLQQDAYNKLGFQLIAL